MRQNGIHDYLKYIKFGYGRCTNYTSKDIRYKKYNYVKSFKDLNKWLKYTGITKEKFDKHADAFRDSRVWFKKDDEWVKKYDLWD
tara:strand:+ start:1151 stop:1405 length:255 start_codon:yes stop_codon:yes gene_type:complete